jgi:hypothetical protein
VNRLLMLDFNFGFWNLRSESSRLRTVRFENNFKPSNKQCAQCGLAIGGCATEAAALADEEAFAPEPAAAEAVAGAEATEDSAFASSLDSPEVRARH